MGLIMPYLEPRVFRMSYPEHVGFRTYYYWTCGIQNILLWTYGVQIILFSSRCILNIFHLKVWDSKYRYLDCVQCRIAYLERMCFRVSYFEHMECSISYHERVGLRMCFWNWRNSQYFILSSWDLLGLTLNPRDLENLNRLNTDKGREADRRKE
jgi:hypothetical protein